MPPGRHFECIDCKKDFECPGSRGSLPKRCDNCYDVYYKKRAKELFRLEEPPTGICSFCGEKYKNWYDSKFCSQMCYTAFRRSYNGPWKSKKWMECAHCKEQFIGRLYIYGERTDERENSLRFCSKNCMSIHFRGPGSPVWKGGQSLVEPLHMSLYGDKEYRKICSEVWALDDATCQRCGEKATTETKSRFHVHHIVPIRVRPDMAMDTWNLVLLCISCHGQVHTHPKDQFNECFINENAWSLRY